MPDDLASRPLLGAMRVTEAATYSGPHLFSHIPMVRFRLDLGALEERPSNTLPGFNGALLETLPGLAKHGCTVREEGGFAARLRDGTWLGHVIEHVALELQTMAGHRVTRGKTRSVRGKPGVYDVLYAYRDAGVGRMAGRAALELVDGLLPPELRGAAGAERLHDEPVMVEGLDAAIEKLRRAVRRANLGPTTLSLVREAERRGIPVLRLDDQSLLQLGHGARQKRVRASITGETSSLAVEIAGDKDMTKRILAGIGVPVPEGAVVRSADEAASVAKRLGFPVVAKPLDGNHGRGVTLDLESEEAVRRAFDAAAAAGKRTRAVVIEQQFRGRDHRVLVVGGQVRAVAERVPAHVVGDGTSTMAQLVERVNQDPRRGDGHENLLTKIKIDNHVLELLAKSGLTPESVPDPGRCVALRDTANLSTGGTAIDRTDDIHPENASICRRAALAIGLDVAGIDFLCPDIRKSVRETGGGIVEVNAAPGFRMHLEPFEGWARDIARPVIDRLFPPGETGRVPLIAITGTNGKSTTTRMVARILRHTGLTVGTTSTSGVWVNDERVRKGDCSGPQSARMLLRDPTVEACVLETARGGILREGLAFDRCDVGCVLNIQPDHLGLKGIDTLEDLARVKGVVVEAVRREGASVLNADDPHCARMARHAGGRVAFFSMNGDNPSAMLREHIARGRLAVVYEERAGTIVVHDNARRLPIMGAAEIPATMGGMALFNVANALAAVAMAYAHGVTPPAIRAALQTFQSDWEENPGRLNVHTSGGVTVVMDYAHNPPAFAALCDLLRRMPAKRRIGMVSCPGDRRDEDMRELGRIASGVFHEIVVRERPEGRGRAPGEILKHLSDGVLEGGFDEARLHRVAHEREALELALSLARPGDLVLATPSDLEAAWMRIRAFAPAKQTEAAE